MMLRASVLTMKEETHIYRAEKDKKYFHGDELELKKWM